MSALASLARDLAVDERTLRRAVGEGTLRGSRRSPRKLDLPLSERRYARRAWPLIAALRAVLRTERNVRLALLFGSAARGTDDPGGDVDVLVALRDPRLERVVDLKAKLARTLGRGVDVVRLEDAEADPAFLAAVLADGRMLVDRERLWRRLQADRAALHERARRAEDERMRAALAAIDRLLGS
jgi:predicted nucleotidyltransferase